MLIAVTVMPIVFSTLADVPEGTSAMGAPSAFVVTLLVIVAFALRGGGALRLWAPLFGVIAGSAVAAFFGFYDFERVRAAEWVGIPVGGWPGLDLGFGPEFWALLPAFIFVTFVGAIETVGDSIAIQRVSWRKQRAPDFRVVQGAVAADGAGNLLSGIAGTVPNTTYSSSVAIAELTGVAARRIGALVGLLFLVVTFFPKFAAFFLAIPNPVISAYLLALLALLFVLGMRMVVQDGMDIGKATIVGVSFWVGTGFQEGAIFGAQLGEWWGALLGNGMTAGALTAILLTLFVEWTGARRRRFTAALDDSTGPLLDDFLAGLARRHGWKPAFRRPAPRRRGRGAALAPRRGRRGGGGGPAPAADRPRRPAFGGTGVRRRRRRPEPRGPAGAPAGCGGCLHRRRDFTAPPPPLHEFRAPPEVPRGGHRDRPCRRLP